MIIEVDGVRMEVPDDATPEEIDAIAPKPKPPPSFGQQLASTLGKMGTPLVPKPAKGDQGSPTKWSQKLGEGVPGFNRLAALAQATGDTITGKNEYGPDFGSRFSEHLKAEQGQSARTQQEAPWTSAALQTAGALPLAAAFGQGTTGLAGELKAGGGAGAMYGLGDTRGTTPAEQAMDTVYGAAGGMLASQLPRAMNAVGNGFRWVGDKLLPRVMPTPAAQRLLAEGVPLTTGQIAGPNSGFGQSESVSAKLPFGLDPERKAAEQATMRVMQNKGVAPGAQIPQENDLQARLSELVKGFGPAYDKIRGQPINPATLDALPAAADVPGRGVDRRTAAGVKAEVENALSVLGKPAQPVEQAPSGLLDASGKAIPAPPAAPPEPLQATAGDLLKVRENIRQNVRAARQAQDFDRLRLLEGAEDVVTGALDANLSPEHRQLLRDTDRQYARLMTSANAAPAGQTTFTPLQFLKQVEKASGRRTFKQGGAGDLQDLGEAARATFVDAPLTGYLGAAAKTIPGGARTMNAVSAWANTPAGKALLMRQGSPTIPYRADNPGLVPGRATLSPEIEALINALRGRAGGPRLAPAAADEETPR